MSSFEYFSTTPEAKRSAYDILAELPHASRIQVWPSDIIELKGEYFLAVRATILSNSLIQDAPKEDKLVVPKIGVVTLLHGLVFKGPHDMCGVVLDITKDDGTVNQALPLAFSHASDSDYVDRRIPVAFCTDTAHYESLLALYKSGIQPVNGRPAPVYATKPGFVQ